jgi:predicted TIM-barrel fold metal-dependent hydrolase
MKLEEMVLVSVDDHIVEPATVFDHHLPARWKDRAPKLVIHPETGVQTWSWEGGDSASPCLNAVVTLPKEEWGFDPHTQAEVRPAAYDVDLRVRDMDANGVLASMCFPSFAGFAGNYFMNAQDRDLAFACLQAYNDWHIEEWAGSHPGRFIPLALPAIWDPELSAAEVRRVARKGVHAIGFSEDTVALGAPSIHSGAWDPFFAACVEEGVVLAIHIGSGFSAGNMPSYGEGAPVDVSLVLPCWNALPCAANFLTSKALQKFPDLRIALSEGGTSWIPGFLDRMERHHANQKWTGWDLGGLSPTETFQRHFLTCFVSDPSGLLLRDRIGIDNIAYEVDYPHSDCSWPGSPEEVWEHIVEARCTDEEIDKITWQNASRWLHFDPFAQIAREDGNVGALRARAGDVDLQTRSKADYRAAYEQRHTSA